MSTPVGQTATHWPQSTQSPAGLPAAQQRLGFLERAARFAAIDAIGDVERPFVGQRRLDARPWTHVEAHLLARETREDIGRWR